MSATTQPIPANADDVVNAALALSPEERAMVAHLLLDSLDAPFDDPEEVKRAWKEEIARRIADYQAGRMKAIPVEEALARLRDGLRKERRP